jgi:hypothetical protein
MREPFNPGYHVRQDDGRKKKKNDDLLKEFRELHTEEENICRDWSHRQKSYTEEICSKQLISQEKKSFFFFFFFFFLGLVMYFWSFWQRIHPSLAETVKHGQQLLLCMLNFVEEGKMGYKYIIECEVLQISYNSVCSAVLVWVRGFGYDADDDADDDEKPRSWIWLELFIVFSFTFWCVFFLGACFEVFPSMVGMSTSPFPEVSQTGTCSNFASKLETDADDALMLMIMMRSWIGLSQCLHWDFWCFLELVLRSSNPWGYHWLLLFQLSVNMVSEFKCHSASQGVVSKSLWGQGAWKGWGLLQSD